MLAASASSYMRFPAGPMPAGKGGKVEQGFSLICSLFIIAVLFFFVKVVTRPTRLKSASHTGTNSTIFVSQAATPAKKLYQDEMKNARKFFSQGFALEE